MKEKKEKRETERERGGEKGEEREVVTRWMNFTFHFMSSASVSSPIKYDSPI